MNRLQRSPNLDLRSPCPLECPTLAYTYLGQRNAPPGPGVAYRLRCSYPMPLCLHRCNQWSGCVSSTIKTDPIGLTHFTGAARHAPWLKEFASLNRLYMVVTRLVSHPPMSARVSDRVVGGNRACVYCLPSSGPCLVLPNMAVRAGLIIAQTSLVYVLWLKDSAK